MTFTQLHMWLSLGFILILIELLGFTGFLIGAGVAAWAVAFLVWIGVIESLRASVGLYAVLSVVLTWACIRYLRTYFHATDRAGGELHNRARRQVGKTFVLDHAVGDDAVPHFIGDTRWRVRSTGLVLEPGTRVKVDETEDGILIVVPADAA